MRHAFYLGYYQSLLPPPPHLLPLRLCSGYASLFTLCRLFPLPAFGCACAQCISQCHLQALSQLFRIHLAHHLPPEVFLDHSIRSSSRSPLKRPSTHCLPAYHRIGQGVSALREGARLSAGPSPCSPTVCLRRHLSGWMRTAVSPSWREKSEHHRVMGTAPEYIDFMSSLL